jgi:carotenoid 1,2-hydratase
VFSPYYAHARRRGRGDPLNHCALNVALYNSGSKRWAMTERGRGHLHLSATSLVIGPSTISWNGDALTIQIDETTAPIPSALRGTVRVYPKALGQQKFALDAAGDHRWQPIAPCAHVEVQMSKPSLHWHGSGYVDSNSGDAALEDAFQSWNWSRVDLRRGTAVLYDVRQRDGTRSRIGLLCDPAGEDEVFDLPPKAALPPTRWGIPRETHADTEHPPKILKTLESAPFYARSLIATRLFGEQALAMHESLSLDRFRSGWVQAMLPFRMPRALNWRTGGSEKD